MEKSVVSSSPWYIDWQNREHASAFDVRHALTDWQLLKIYESFSDVQLLRERTPADSAKTLLEVGCATGDFHRYLKLRLPRLRYLGADISQAAIARAQEKYPDASFHLIQPGTSLAQLLPMLGLNEKPDIVYSKDVVHHQVRPMEFVSDLLGAASETVIFRTRTRDVGPTLADPNLSCQYHYQGWMPYIVINLDELLNHIRREAPRAEILVYRNHMVLGGRENRFLPKECYLPETGTAETTVAVFLKTDNAGRVQVEDRKDMDPAYPLGYRLKNAAHRTFHRLIGR